jgi:hypothetical protein
MFYRLLTPGKLLDLANHPLFGTIIMKNGSSNQQARLHSI